MGVGVGVGVGWGIGWAAGWGSGTAWVGWGRVEKGTQSWLPSRATRVVLGIVPLDWRFWRSAKVTGPAA